MHLLQLLFKGSQFTLEFHNSVRNMQEEKEEVGQSSQRVSTYKWMQRSDRKVGQVISNHTTQNQANYLIYMSTVSSHVRNEIWINLNILKRDLQKLIHLPIEWKWPTTFTSYILHCGHYSKCFTYINSYIFHNVERWCYWSTAYRRKMRSKGFLRKLGSGRAHL